MIYAGGFMNRRRKKFFGERTAVVMVIEAKKEHRPLDRPILSSFVAFRSLF